MKELTIEERSKQMILDPDQWPCWPRLPMKRIIKAGDWPELGFINASEYSVIYQTLLYAEITPTTKKITYKNIDAMLADGWIVD